MQGLHEDACRAYLDTLRRTPTAEHIWSYLRLSLASMNQQDLVELANKHDLASLAAHFGSGGGGSSGAAAGGGGGGEDNIGDLWAEEAVTAGPSTAGSHNG